MNLDKVQAMYLANSQGMNARADNSIEAMKSFALSLKDEAEKDAAAAAEKTGTKDASLETGVKADAKTLNDRKLDKVAKEFEAVFISQMLAPMFEGIETDPVFGGGQGEEMFRSMMVEEYGKMLAERGGVGLQAAIKEKLLSYQSAAQQN